MKALSVPQMVLSVRTQDRLQVSLQRMMLNELERQIGLFS